MAEQPAELRYVVLHHEGVAWPHYDLMFEREAGGELMTFRCARWPIAGPTAVERLPDHRREYLDYEGPVSNHRGAVRQVQSGRYRADSQGTKFTLITPNRRELRIFMIGEQWWIEPGH